MKVFWQGVAAGFLSGVILLGVILAMIFFYKRDREFVEYAEKQNEIQSLREDYGNRDPYEFFNDVPGVRRAARDAAGEFRRKRDEAVQRIRSRLSSGARLAD